MNVLITGCSGFIGRNCVKYYIDLGFNVYGIDLKICNYTDKKFTFQKTNFLDFSEYRECMILFKPDYIIHLAAQTGMNSNDPSDFDFNYKSILVINEIINHVRTIRKVIFTSSLLVCKNGYIPYNDNDYCPPNGYGHSKSLSEIYVRKYIKNCKWDIVRPTSVWGPYFNGGYKLFFTICKLNLFFFPKTVPILKPTTFVLNAIYMIHKILLNNGSSRTFYLADYPCISVQDWASEILLQCGHNKLKTVNLKLMFFIASICDIMNKFIKIIPFSTFRLNNMLTNQVYPTDALEEIVGELPYSLKKSVNITLGNDE